MLHFTQVLISLFIVSFATLAHSAPITADSELQTLMIRLYSEGHCDGVRSLEPKVKADKLRPNVLAIYAYCEPKNQDPEKLFALAEQKNPTGDLILVLHGKYLWKKNPKLSTPIWEKVLMIARNDYFRDLAKDYLANVVSKEANEKTLDLSPNTAFAQFSLGGLHQDHAQPKEFSFDQTSGSYGQFLQADLSYRHWNPLGSVAYHYQTEYDRYNNMERYNLWSNSLEVPVAIHVATAKDIIFRPIVGYRTLGGKAFDLSYGIGVKAAVYQSDYVQSVQALIYSTHIYDARISPEQGAHYRFEYNWDFYPHSWFISTEFAMEHVSSSSASRFLGKSGTFEMSHNDFILDLKFHKEFSKFTLGMDPKLIARLDTNPSTYLDVANVNPIIKRREDWEIHLNGNISIPLLPSLQAYAWYEWTKIFSNFSSQDYVNRNFANQTVGLALKTSLSTY